MIDHLVYATPDLDRTVAELARRLGDVLVPGGAHPGRGTRNVLAGLGDGAYLEVIGPDPDQQDPVRPRPFGIDGLAGPGLVTWALRTTDVDAAVAAARRAGHDPGPPAAMSRARPDGVRLDWRLTPSAEAGPSGGVLPFLIGWGATPHPADDLPPGLVLRSLAAEHPEPAPIRTALAALGADLTVVAGPRPRLRAVVRTPHGDVELG